MGTEQGVYQPVILYCMYNLVIQTQVYCSLLYVPVFVCVVYVVWSVPHQESIPGQPDA